MFVCYAFSFETPERSVYDESGLNYNDHVNNQTDCTDLGSGGGGGLAGGIGGVSGNGGTPSSCLQLKAEPLGGLSSPESSSETLGPDDCAGCGRLIQVCIFVVDSMLDICWQKRERRRRIGPI